MKKATMLKFTILTLNVSFDIIDNNNNNINRWKGKTCQQERTIYDVNNSLRVAKWWSESVNRRTYNTVAKRKGPKDEQR